MISFFLVSHLSVSHMMGILLTCCGGNGEHTNCSASRDDTTRDEPGQPRRDGTKHVERGLLCLDCTGCCYPAGQGYSPAIGLEFP